MDEVASDGSAASSALSTAASTALPPKSHPRPNLAAVAALAGVSASTASLAFSGSGPVSDATRARVLAAAASLDYAGPDPRAQRLRNGRSGIIGVVIEDRLSDAFRDPMNLAMLDGIADETGATGAGLLLLTENGSGSASIDSAPVDGVIFIGCSTSLAGPVDIFRRRGIALVAVEAQRIDDVLPIDLDNREASRTLADHLKNLGHEHVAIVSLPLDVAKERAPITADRERLATGFTSSERIAGVREIFPSAIGVTAAGSSIEEGEIAGAALLGGSVLLGSSSGPATDRPTAIIAQSDLLAAGVIRAAESIGLVVPDDLSVVGFDGVRVDGIGDHDLTTMVQPAVAKGRAAGRALRELLAGGHPQAVSFSSEFHLGNTTAPPPIASKSARSGQ